MWNLAEYRRHPRRLADHLPWAALVGPGVVLNKDGSLQRTLAFRGPDLDSSTPHELLAARARANNVLRRLGSGWCVHAEASRRAAPAYPAGAFPCPVATLVEGERRAAFDGEGQHFESRHYLTLAYLPPPEAAARLGDLLIERPRTASTDRVAAAYRAHYDQFVAQTDGVASLLATFMPHVQLLDDAATLTYLHACVSDRALNVAVPPTPFYLDEMLTDRPLTGGLSPRLGDQYLKTVSIRAYADRTLPCLLDRLNGVPVEYRWVGR